jgi:hypothetical protein
MHSGSVNLRVLQHSIQHRVDVAWLDYAAGTGDEDQIIRLAGGRVEWLRQTLGALPAVLFERGQPDLTQEQRPRPYRFVFGSPNTSLPRTR